MGRRLSATPEQIAQYKAEYESEGVSMSEIARRHGWAEPTMNRYLRGVKNTTNNYKPKIKKQKDVAYTTIPLIQAGATSTDNIVLIVAKQGQLAQLVREIWNANS